MSEPRSVRQAKLANDTNALSALGKKGAKASAESKRRRKKENECMKMRTFEEMTQLARERNDHLLPVDELPSGASQIALYDSDGNFGVDDE
jgi:hypothetical protein